MTTFAQITRQAARDDVPAPTVERDYVLAHFMSRLKKTGRPSVLTVNGKPALVVMDAEAWQDNQDLIEYARTVAGIRKGLDQARDGQGVEAGAFFGKSAAGKK